MNVYEVEITLKSPTLISKTSFERLIAHERFYISGQTFRGAFLTALLREGVDISKEEKNPKLIFHPLYPVQDGETAKPAHPLIYECKICGNITSILRDLILEKKEFKIPRSCKNGHIFSMKSMKGSILIKENDRYRKVKLEYIVMHSVGINRIFRSSEFGMLYGYACLSPETTFKGIIVDLEDRFAELSVPSVMKIRIGRGGSRGLGIAELKIRKNNDIFNQRKKEIRKILKKNDNIIILRATSPVFRFYNGTSVLLEPEIDFADKYYIHRNISSIISGTIRVSGFSIKYGVPKISIRCADIGSLFFYKADKNVLDGLVLREFVGFGPFNYSGLNILEVIGVDG